MNISSALSFVAAAIFFVAFLLTFGVIFDKQSLENVIGLATLGLSFFAAAHI